jgi:hypothetical protein
VAAIQIAGFHMGSTNLGDPPVDWSPGRDTATCGGRWPLVKGAAISQNHHWAEAILCSDEARVTVNADAAVNHGGTQRVGSPPGDTSSDYLCGDEGDAQAMIGLSGPPTSPGRELCEFNWAIRCAPLSKPTKDCRWVDFWDQDSAESGGEDDWRGPDYNNGTCGYGRIITGAHLQFKGGPCFVPAKIRCCSIAD